MDQQCEKFLYATCCTGMVVCIIQPKWDPSHYLYAISKIIFLCFPKNTCGYLYTLVKYELNYDIIKCPQLFTHILRKNDSGKESTKLSLHRISDSQKYSLFLSQEPRIFCFRNYRVCGTNYPLGTNIIPHWNDSRTIYIWQKFNEILI